MENFENKEFDFNLEQNENRILFNKERFNENEFFLIDQQLINAPKNNFNKTLDLLRLKQVNEQFKEKIDPFAVNQAWPNEELNRKRGTPTVVVEALPEKVPEDAVKSLPATTKYLEVALAKYGLSPVDALFRMRRVLTQVPQMTEDKEFLYLLTSGLSVEIITGYIRPHKDVDLVLMHPEVNKYPILSTTDNVVPHEFWAGMKLDNSFLTYTAYRAALGRHTPVIGEGTVYCAHPAITMVQKISDAWGRNPREHDIYDGTAMVYWLLQQPDARQERDILIARAALDSMDTHQAAKTADRLNVMFAKHPKVLKRLIEPTVPDEALTAAFSS